MLMAKIVVKVTELAVALLKTFIQTKRRESPLT